MTIDTTPPITYRVSDGLTFEPDRIRPEWLRCSTCLELVLATPAAIKRHECRYPPAEVSRGAQREPGPPAYG